MWYKQTKKKANSMKYSSKLVFEKLYTIIVLVTYKLNVYLCNENNKFIQH